MWHVWSRGHCCHAVTRDEEIIFTRAPVQRSKSAVCGAGWLGGHSDHWSGLACLNWSWLVAITINQCINILKVSLSKLMNSSNHTPWLSVAGAAEISSRVCWWWWWWQCWCWLLTSSSLPRTIRNTNLGHAHLSLHIDVVTFYFLFTLDCSNFPISHQPIGVKINISDQ